MTALDLDGIKARVEAATPAPWQRANHVVDMGPPSDSPFAVCHSDADPSPSPQNAEFIAHAREDVPALIAEVERYRDTLEDLAKDCEAFPEDHRWAAIMTATAVRVRLILAGERP